MEHLYDSGKCCAIGVSNYTISHLDELLDQSSITPAVNQVEFHPYLYQEELLEFCRSKNIQLESYSPLTKGRQLNDSILKKIGEKYGKTPAQILIRWNIEHNVIVIPKSSNKVRIQQNSEVFDFKIKPEDMKILNELSRDLRTSWDPSSIL